MTKPSRRFGLSKSKITMFEQCPKRLWLSLHRPELAQVDDGIEARFATGHEIGAIACSLLPDGVMIEAEPDLEAALSTTKALLDGGHHQPIFEATLEHDGVLVRIDVLEPDGAGGWRMAEVKSSTRPKDYHISDIATQLWVARMAGLQISSAAIRHIDNSFALKVEGDYAGLLTDTDLSAAAEPIVATRAEVVAAAREALAGDEPSIAPGAHCDSPFACEFAEYCQQALPPGPEWPVTVLPSGGGRRWLERGTTDLFDVDPSALSNRIHARVYRATVTGEHFHDAAGARAAMSDWGPPRTWLDFETIAFAAPRWIGTRPYQQVPFQFSAHVEQEDGSIEHHEFLSLDGTDPRRSCAEALIHLIPQTGAVIGYNAAFEKARILELSECCPDLVEDLRGIAERVVDLLPITRANWYHRDQRGSWSIKAVLPTVDAALDYATLEVKDGGNAQAAYLEAIDPACCDDRREVLGHALKAYCSLDTWAMIAVARHLATDPASLGSGGAAGNSP
jgi:CRISPR/Cas system-associated exonuclease Cas4 (RecB family)